MRHWMESAGWLQGSIVKNEDVAQLLKLANKLELIDEPEIVLIVASGSCDIANNSDPILEFSVGRRINKIDGNFSLNKNPRRLQCRVESSADLSQVNLELKAYEKIVIIKDAISHEIRPDNTMQFTQYEMNFYVEWLAGRYKRPAFPTEFDKRIDNAWDKSKRKKAAAKVSEKLIGIYAKVYPDSEISEDKNYAVDLLALTIEDLKDSDKDEIEKLINQYRSALLAARMDVGKPIIASEFKVSVGKLRQYKRFNLDELSYKNDDPLPPEINLT